VVLSNYTFFQVLWWMIVFFAFVIWFWLLITVFADIFRRHDTSGWGKALWIIFIIILPFLGVFIYLIANHQGMADRNMKTMEAAQASQEAYIKSVAASGGPADEIDKAKKLLDAGTITQDEFEAMKAKALASS
jgi:magnesium-transporting ATPase (P-type)